MHISNLYVHPLTGAHRSEVTAVPSFNEYMAADRWWVLYDAALPPGEPNRVSQKRYRQLARVGATMMGDIEVVSLSVPQGEGETVLRIPFTTAESNCIVNEFGDETPAIDLGDQVAEVFATYLGLPSVRLAQKRILLNQASSLDPRTRKQMPIHIVTAESVRELQRRGGAQFGPERFRPNIVIETGGEPFEEESWVGRSLRIQNGEVVVPIERATPRCPVPGYDQETGENRKDVPKLYGQLSKDAQGTAVFGVYGYVANGRRTGLFEVGQEVSLHG